MKKKRFAIIGVGGYVAPKHVEAIYATGGEVAVCCDISDSVGFLDKWDYNIEYFKNPVKFFRWIKEQEDIDYISICTPNHLHVANILLGLEAGCDIICEKPVALDYDIAMRVEESAVKAGRKIYPVLQLRRHDEIKEIEKGKVLGIGRDVLITYITPRGLWYRNSWKHNQIKSGGVLMNIGIHLFDLILHLFGDISLFDVHMRTDESAAGVLYTEGGIVRFFLSIDPELFQKEYGAYGESKPIRRFMIDGEHINLSADSEQLHIREYEGILSGNGTNWKEACKSIELVNQLEKSEVTKDTKNCHPLLKELRLL